MGELGFGENRLNVSSKGHVTSRPTERDGDEATSDLPCPANIVGGHLGEGGENPDKVQLNIKLAICTTED